MATRAVPVRKSLQTQADMQHFREHCSADAHALAAHGTTVCQQVRVKRTESNSALYTVSEVRHEDTDEIVRIGPRGRLHLGTDEEFDAGLDSQVVDPPMSDEKAKDNGEFIERLHDDGPHTGVVVIEPHGGLIQERTDDQAQQVAFPLGGQGGELLAVRATICRAPTMPGTSLRLTFIPEAAPCSTRYSRGGSPTPSRSTV
jgi:hypothetical protein